MKNRNSLFAGILAAVFITIFAGSCASNQAPTGGSATYTFSPRLRATQGGVEKDVYLDRIIIRDGYFNVCLVDTPLGKGSYYNISRNWGNNTQNSTVLWDLDQPTQTWPATRTGEDAVTGGMFVTFNMVTATRLCIVNDTLSPPIVFEEITLSDPDLTAPQKNTSATSPNDIASDGIYTFSPRLRVSQGGMDIDVYLDRVEIRNGYLNIYLVDTPVGKGSYYNTNRNWGRRDSTYFNKPDNVLYYQSPSDTGEDNVTGGLYITFSKANKIGKQINLINRNVNPQIVFEIILGEPDFTTPQGNASAASSNGSVSNGTYTFSPRLRATRGGRDVDLYLDRVEIKGFLLKSTIVYLVDTPVGRGNRYNTSRNWGGGDGIGEDSVTGGISITLGRIPSSPFHLTGGSPGYDVIFSEVILGEPDPVGPKF